MIEFQVVGKPEPAGSKRAFCNPRTGGMIVTDANRKAKPWQATVAVAAAEAMQGRELITGPVALSLTFYRARPAGHYGTGRNSRLVKASAPDDPITKPDVLKLARGVEDALTGIVWRDDAQIVDEELYKRYGTPERCVVRVVELAEPRVVDRRLAA